MSDECPGGYGHQWSSNGRGGLICRVCGAGR